MYVTHHLMRKINCFQRLLPHPTPRATPYSSLIRDNLHFPSSGKTLTSFSLQTFYSVPMCFTGLCARMHIIDLIDRNIRHHRGHVHSPVWLLSSSVAGSPWTRYNPLPITAIAHRHDDSITCCLWILSASLRQRPWDVQSLKYVTIWSLMSPGNHVYCFLTKMLLRLHHVYKCQEVTGLTG